MASANIEQAFNVYLRTSVPAGLIAGDRYYFVEAPQGATLPYVTYFIVSDPHEPFTFGNIDAGQARIQFNVYTDEKYGALIKTHALRDILDKYTGVLDAGVTLEVINCSGVRVLKIANQEYQGTFDAMVLYYD